MLTFGMIPHIIQKRRSEYYIHHTGCLKEKIAWEKREKIEKVLRAPGCPATSVQSEEMERGVNTGTGAKTRAVWCTRRDVRRKSELRCVTRGQQVTLHAVSINFTP